MVRKQKATGTLMVILGTGLALSSVVVAIAKAETAIAIFMVIIGVYLVIRGIRVFSGTMKEVDYSENYRESKGPNIIKLVLGLFLFFTGAGFSASIIAIPIMILGMVLVIYC